MHLLISLPALADRRGDLLRHGPKSHRVREVPRVREWPCLRQLPAMVRLPESTPGRKAKPAEANPQRAKEGCPFAFPPFPSLRHAAVAVLPRGAPLQPGPLRFSDPPPPPPPGL